MPPIGSRGGTWDFAAGASEQTLRELRAGAPIGVPDSYFDFLRLTNGGEGSLGGVEPGWFMPWPAEEVLHNNLGYNVAEFLPGLFAFGSNGGGELFAFDLRETGKGSIVMVPFIPMELDEAIVVAASFDEFVTHVGVATDAGTV